MTTSRTALLSKPIPGEAVRPETFAYLRGRAKRKAYDLVMREFRKSGITKTELARRMGKTPPEVSRMLGGPANWTIVTVTDLLFAISGGVPKWDIEFPLDRPRRNDTRPHWLTRDTPLTKVVLPSANTTHSQLLGRASEKTDNDPKKSSFGLGA